jgi:hypothetical protein
MRTLLLLMTVLCASADPATRIRSFFNDLRAENMDLVDRFYSKDVVFIDPAGQIEGREDLRAYYAHLYGPVLDIGFEFPAIQVTDNEAFAVWRMTVSSSKLKRGAPIIVDGLSHIRFDSAGQAIYHRDYFDMGAMIYEQVPVLGCCIRYIKKRLTPKHGDKK